MTSSLKISRRKLAAYVADEFRAGNGELALRQAAAYLVETGRTRSAGLLVRDIEEALLGDGIVVADVTAARPIDELVKAAIAKLFPAGELYIRERIDPSVLGGIRVEIPGQRYEGTLKHKIDLLKEITTKKGTT